MGGLALSCEFLVLKNMTNSSNFSWLLLLCCSTEVLQDPAVTGKLSDTKAAGEVKALEDFYSMLQNDSNRAFYG